MHGCWGKNRRILFKVVSLGLRCHWNLLHAACHKRWDFRITSAEMWSSVLSWIGHQAKFQKFWLFIVLRDWFNQKMAEASSTDGQLTQPQLVRLASSISLEDVETLGLGYLGVKKVEIETLKEKHRTNVEAIKRDIITRWTNRPSNKGPDQVLVYFCSVS